MIGRLLIIASALSLHGCPAPDHDEADAHEVSEVGMAYNEEARQFKKLGSVFPHFVEMVESGRAQAEFILPPASEVDLVNMEDQLGLPLPESYKQFLRTARGVWLAGGAIQLSKRHPFRHQFDSFDKLPPAQQEAIERRGGQWPPPSDGMLCFAEFFWQADGDQVLFDVSKGLINGEYPVMYYAHSTNPPSITKVSDSFPEWMEKCLTYFENDDEE